MNLLIITFFICLIMPLLNNRNHIFYGSCIFWKVTFSNKIKPACDEFTSEGFFLFESVLILSGDIL